MNGNNGFFDDYMDMVLSSGGATAADESFNDFTDSDEFDVELNEEFGINRNEYSSQEEYLEAVEKAKYSWRENYEFDFENNIDPDDYETEEEYLEALEEVTENIPFKVCAQKTNATKSYVVGQTVLHKTFGVGKIVTATPVGKDFYLEIDFEKIGIKKILSSFANLSTNTTEIEAARQNVIRFNNLTEEKTYRFCKVLVDDVEKPCYYLLDKVNVNIKDYVKVSYGDNNDILKGVVVSVGECLECALPCDIQEMKYVLDIITTNNDIHQEQNSETEESNTFFEDENLRMSLVKWERISYLVGGYSMTGTFIVENKSDKRFHITMNDISIGGFLNQDEIKPIVLSGKQKIMDSFRFIHENKIPQHLKGCKTVEFKVSYGELRDGYSTKAFIEGPVTESDIISIKNGY